MMKSRSSRAKIRPMQSVLISMLYRLGVRPKKMVSMFNVSRATIYRHIKK
jgi:transposase